MKDDKIVLAIYSEFKNSVFPMLHAAQLVEAAKRDKDYEGNNKEIYAIYNRYLNILSAAWSLLYRDRKHFGDTVRNIQTMRNGGTIYAKTDIQYYAEQFFVIAYHMVNVRLAFCQGAISQYEADRTFSSMVEDLMKNVNILDPYEMPPTVRRVNDDTWKSVALLYETIISQIQPILPDIE